MLKGKEGESGMLVVDVRENVGCILSALSSGSEQLIAFSSDTEVPGERVSLILP